jgi:hypothetical protein
MIVLLTSVVWAQNPVTFQVNMAVQEYLGAFNPTGGDIVVVRGSFNGWAGNANQCTVTTGDSIYTCVVDFDNSFIGTELNYKFVMVTGGGDVWEGAIPNRVYTVTAGGGTIPVVYFNDQLYPAGLADVEVLFRVDMSVQILSGNFSPDSDIVVVRGDHPNLGNWGGAVAVLEPETGNPDVYSNWIMFDDLPVDDPLDYKFVYIEDNGNGPDHWEQSDNRSFTPTGNEPDILPPPTGNGYGEIMPDVVYFSNIGPEDIITQDVLVCFHVNMKPAYYMIMDVGYIFDVQTGDTVYMTTIDEVDVAGFFNSWPWGGFAPQHIAYDAGNWPDAVGGDSIFSRAIQFYAGDPKELIYKYGISGYDCEAGFAMNHSVMIDDSGPVFQISPWDVFGSPDTIYNQYWGVKPLPNPILPGSFSLHQNYPNPFNPSTNIIFDLPFASEVNIQVFNIKGEEVYDFTTGRLTPGSYSYEFNASDLSSGLYFYKVQAGNYSSVKKMTLLK